ncbi:MAG: lamin tail domain-containing protein [Myxococcaceae bacterium]|nr:lamin tail domain-containing protein [Myxococcaceae bacterium]
MKLRTGVLLALIVPAIACRPPDKPKPPPNPPAITSFTVDKQAIRRGELVTFSFTVERAQSVELVDQTGANVAVAFDELSGVGSAKASPDRTTFYVLRAEGEGGRDTSFVQVAVDAGLQSVFLVVVPQQVKPGQRVDLIWSAAGGRNVRLMAGTMMLSTMESGSATDTPMRSTTYTLAGERADGSLSTQSATVTVVPQIDAFTATPPAAKPGEKITLTWRTSGAEQVSIAEATFGAILSTTTDVAMGTAEFVVPSFFADAGVFDAGASDPDAGLDDGGVDGGVDAGPPPLPPVPVVRDGFPLRFTLTATTTMPNQQTQRAVDARVGQGPVIELFDAPGFGTRGRPLTLSWRTTGAARIELQANGLPFYTPLAGVSTTGSFKVGNFSADTTFTLVAYDFNGLQVSSAKLVRAVAPPRIISFIVPMAAPTAGMRITATWMTADATFLLLRLKGGPAFFREDGVNSVANGTTQFTVPLKGTYVFEAYNAAGDKAVEERLIDVGAPIQFTINPELLGRGELTTMTWDVGLLSANDMPGLLNPPPAVAMNATAFDDLTMAPTARQLFFANRDDGTATITLPNGFVFPFATRQARQLTVSTNGFVALTAGAGALAVNQDLSDVGYSGPPLLAPFWDDLELGADGRVLWNLDEATMPRRLTISWHKVKRVGAMGSDLTFQVQLFETGKFLFAWEVLDGPGADGSDATIGAIDAVDAYQGLVSFNSSTAAELAVDTERVWFSGNLEGAGQRQLRLRGPSVLGFVVETAQERIPVYGRARAFGPSDVLITEAMPAPLQVVPQGQWVELYNPSADGEVDVAGLRLESGTGANPFVLPADTILPPNGFFVVGQSMDPGLNGDAGVRLEWSAGALPLTLPDSVRLVLPTQLADGGTLVVSRLGWGGFNSILPDGGPGPDGGVDQGASVQAPENVLVRSGQPPFRCARTLTFGPPGQTGTPGARNEECFPYVLSEIPVNYEDISAATGPISFTFSILNDDGAASVPLPTSFSYFGQTYGSVRVCSNGWASFVDTSSTSFSNKTLPSSSTPIQTLAPFWADLFMLPASAAFAARRGDRTIIQWKDFTTYANRNSPTPDVLNFQIKLFDSGVIEFHYATMTGANGVSATRWIDNPDGTAALAISVNQPTVLPNTAFRFTPRSLLGGTP